MIQSISTVNVIDFADQCGTVNQMVSFPDTSEGCEAAGLVFKDWVREAAGDNTPSEDDLESALDDGTFHIGDGSVVLVHSTIGRSEYPTEEVSPETEEGRERVLDILCGPRRQDS